MDESRLEPHAERDERLQLDYEQTLTTWRTLVDLRFKLLAFVPTISGGLVALAGRSPSGASALVAALALTALFGIVMYDLRNSVFHDAAVHRAKELEIALDLPLLSDKGPGHGGLMNERPRDRYRLLGVEVWHDRALFVVYSASAAGLAAVGVLGVLAELSAPNRWRLLWIALVTVLVFTVVCISLHRYARQVEQPTRIPASPTPT
jgi:FtsH-binding integral membrane protein